MKLLIRWLINSAALIGITYLVPDIGVSSFSVALLAALVLGIVNALLGNILKLFALPITILTLGLFTLVINGLMFWFVGYLIDGFTVNGFKAAFIGALLLSVVSWLTHRMLKK